MTINSLKSMPYAQAKVKSYDDGTIVLTSYATDVATINSNGWLVVHGLYSMTTRKHISAFVKEYASTTYQVAKMIYENREMYNIFTGELEDI